MTYFIGLEGISQRFCVAVLAERNGRILAACRLPLSISLHTTSQDVLRKRIFQLLRSVLVRANLQTDALANSTICIGLTGTTFSYDREVILPKILAQMQIAVGRLVCTGDVEVVFASHTQSQAGSAVLCHCGSTAYAVSQTNGTLNHVRFGGWGPVLGDEGSAFHMGRSALRQLAREHDTRQENPSILWEEVNSWLSKRDFALNEWARGSICWRELTRDFKAWADGTGHRHDPRTLIFYFAHRPSSNSDNEGLTEEVELLRRIASGLVIPLFAAKERGDPIAHEILQRGLHDLADQHTGAIAVSNRVFQQALVEPIVFYGGVFDHNPQFSTGLAAVLDARYHSSLRPITADSPTAMRPVLGALLFALGDSVTGNLRLPAPAVIAEVRRSAEDRQFAKELKND